MARPVEAGALIEESAEDLYENAPCGYISTRPDGTIVKANQTLLNWLDYSREELLAGKRFQDLLAIGGKIFHETHYAPLLRMQGFVNEVNFDLVGKGGRSLPVLVNTAQKKDASGQVLLYRTTIFNITDRKNYERELLVARQKAEQATKAKADFLSMMSHEIRTPMNAIIGLSHLLRQTRLSEQQQKYADVLHTSSENLLALLNNILDFSKIEAGKVSLEERNFHLPPMIEGIFHTLRVKADEKRLALRLELEEQVPAWLMGDTVKIGQVLTNLVSNAIKFTETGSITVSARVLEQHAEAVTLEFRVRDTGIGIPPDRLSKVFEEFTQASYDINLKYGGTGLGLTICQRLLELYGSKLQVESVLGQGTTFSFPLRLRLGMPEQEAVGSVEGRPDAQRLQGIRVLVADDQTINVFVLSQFLRKWSVEFDVVQNGKQVIEKLQQSHYDLVLMDLQMPEMDGYETTHNLRALPDERFRRLPILALTASARLGLEERLDLAGFTDFIGKPFRPDDLFAKLALYTGRSQQAAPGRPPIVPAPEPEETEAPGSSGRFNLDRFRDLAEGDRHALLELSTLAIHNCERSKVAFQQAIENADPQEFEFHSHRMKMTLELMQTHALWEALQRSREYVMERGTAPEPERAQALVRDVHHELDALILALKEEVRLVAARLSVLDEV
ncbi:PAS domain-containing hybrid sensor histidine kinase/response regulator [Hyalangium versicolor]|uniref:PAS domain-containing hybrid sensor histidine kinase/response regulator n=1 Tax=Hyalangium versicolor TaxID=2861190 RepID=UPI001CC96DC1|nr:PAS domain-containing hybrid sensor histidine kinase/response regulator [Hyalangium versicolor]